MLILCFLILSGLFPPPTSLQLCPHHHPNPTGFPAAAPTQAGIHSSSVYFPGMDFVGQTHLTELPGRVLPLIHCMPCCSQPADFYLTSQQGQLFFPTNKLSTRIIPLNRVIVEGSKEEKTFLER